MYTRVLRGAFKIIIIAFRRATLKRIPWEYARYFVSEVESAAAFRPRRVNTLAI